MLEYNFIVSLTSWILTLSIVIGQLIKIPLGSGGGLTVLDAVIILFVIWGTWQIKFKFNRPPFFIKAAGTFIVICTVSLALTPLHLNPSQYLFAFFYTLRFTVYLLLGWLLLSEALPSLRQNLDQILLYSGIYLAALGLLQFIFLPDLQFLTPGGWDPHFFRMVSTFLDPNFAGAFFVLTLLILTKKLNSQKHSKLLTFHFSLFTLLYLALLTTFSRSSYLMFLVATSILAFLRKSTGIFLTSLLLFAFLLLSFQVYIQLISQPRNIDREKSAQFRLNTWQQGWEIFQRSPFLGTGYNAYRYAIKEYNLGDEQFIQSHGSTSNDSSLLFVAATTGIIGLSSYLLFLASIVNYSWGKNLPLIAALAGLIIHSVFANSLFYPPVLAWIVLCAVSPRK